MRSAGVLRELGEHGRSAPDDDDGVVGHGLVSQVRPQLLPLVFVGHAVEARRVDRTSTGAS